ncbi:hypothetical protein M0802_000990 [Mischocyttarus mexicanus]|nr:hypothetical protein M0802_000990 [Mischocyttarus mexicanus]
MREESVGCKKERDSERERVEDNQWYSAEAEDWGRLGNISGLGTTTTSTTTITTTTTSTRIDRPRTYSLYVVTPVALATGSYRTMAVERKQVDVILFNYVSSSDFPMILNIQVLPMN